MRCQCELTFHQDASLSSDISISIKLRSADVQYSKDGATIIINGPKGHTINIAQQLAWVSTVFRISQGGQFARSEFMIHESKDANIFNLKLFGLRNVRATPRACWHPLFLNGVLAFGFPIRARDGEIGIEIPFEAMTYLAGISGPMEYGGGLILKGYSTIIFPKPLSPRSIDLGQTSCQWHLIYDRKPTPLPLSMLAGEESRALWPLMDLMSLVHKRTFLGCYKKVNIHLGTKDVSYDRITYSHTNPSRRKPEISGFSFTFALPKFGGPSATTNFTIPKRLSLTREEHSYEQILMYGSTMPLILYDTSDSDRRAWMVPALSVILHMCHIWASLQKKHFPTLEVAGLPYAEAVWDIGREAQKVCHESSGYKLYTSKDGGTPFTLKDLVHRYWSEIERVVGAEKDNSYSGGRLVGWDLMEIVTREPFSQLNEPSTREFKGNWKALASHPNMPVLFCQGLGDVIVPNIHTQKLCRIWESVPTQREYLTATVKCITHWSQRFSGPRYCSQLGRTSFWKLGPEDQLFADCSHDERSSCQRAQELVRNGSRLQSIDDLELQGAIIFGHRQTKKLHKQLR